VQAQFEWAWRVEVIGMQNAVNSLARSRLAGPKGRLVGNAVSI